MIEQQQNIAIELKQLLYNIINNYDVFDENNNDDVEQVRINFYYGINKNSFIPRLTYNSCYKTYHKVFNNVYEADESSGILTYDTNFSIIFPDGEPNLYFNRNRDYIEEEIKLSWFKKFMGFTKIKTTTIYSYNLQMSDFRYDLNDVEVKEIFELLHNKKLEFDNNIVEKHKLEQVSKLNKRFEKYK